MASVRMRAVSPHGACLACDGHRHLSVSFSLPVSVGSERAGMSRV